MKRLGSEKYVVKVGELFVGFEHSQHDGIYDLKLHHCCEDDCEIFNVDIAKKVKAMTSGVICKVEYTETNL